MNCACKTLHGHWVREKYRVIKVAYQDIGILPPLAHDKSILPCSASMRQNSSVWHSLIDSWPIAANDDPLLVPGPRSFWKRNLRSRENLVNARFVWPIFCRSWRISREALVFHLRGKEIDVVAIICLECKVGVGEKLGVVRIDVNI